MDTTFELALNACWITCMAMSGGSITVGLNPRASPTQRFLFAVLTLLAGLLMLFPVPILYVPHHSIWQAILYALVACGTLATAVWLALRIDTAKVA